MATARFSSDGYAIRYVLPVLWMFSRGQRKWTRIKDDSFIFNRQLSLPVALRSDLQTTNKLDPIPGPVDSERHRNV